MRCKGTQRSRRGAIVPWLLLGAGVIIGVVALGTDGGRMLEERRRGQAAADAAALAAGADLYQNHWTYFGKDTGGSARAAALKLAAANGFVNKALALSVLGNPVMVNSTDATAYDQTGFGVVLATRFDLTGNYINPGGALILGTVRTGVPPTPDPLRNLPAPNLAGAP